MKIDLGQGPAPHADGGFGTPTASSRCAPTLAERGHRPAAVLRPAGGGRRTRALAERFPLALITPKTHLFLNSTFANQRRQHAAQPEPFVVIHPADAAPRGIADGARVRVCNDRGAFECARPSSPTTPGRACSSRRWAGGTATTPAALRAGDDARSD